MATHPLHNWSQYLSADDYNYLIQYIENVKHGIQNDKMIILFGYERTGKTTLKNEIADYLGVELCGNYPMTGEFIYNDSIKRLGFFCGIDDIARSQKNNNAIINFIKYKQSFIADTNHIERVYDKLLEHCRVITMGHIF